MIAVSLIENLQGLCGFLCVGHAGYAQEDHDDVICAGVTSIAGTIVTALTDLLQCDVHYDFQPGRLFCVIETEIDDHLRRQTDLLFRTFEIGCKQIEYSYGSQYVHVEENALQLN